MNNLITVEDVNSVLMEYDYVNTFYSLNMQLSDGLFWFRHDFVECSYDYNIDDGGWEFKIENSLWTGEFYLVNNNTNEIIPSSVVTYEFDDETNILKVWHEDSGIDWLDVTLVLYLSSFYDERDIHYLESVIDVKGLHYFEDNTFEILQVETVQVDLNYTCRINGDTIASERENNSISFDFESNHIGVYTFQNSNGDVFYGKIKGMPNLYGVEIPNQNIYTNSINSCIVELINLTEQDRYPQSIELKYNNYNIQYTLSDNVISFDLDLSEVTTPKRINVQLTIINDEVTPLQTFDLLFFANHKTISSYDELLSCVANQDAKIYVGQSFAFIGVDLSIGYDCELIGVNEDADNLIQLNINYHTIFVESGSLKLSNLILRRGDTLIKQNKGTTVTFSNCKLIENTNEKDKASILEYNTFSEDIDDDIVTTARFEDCTLQNCEIPFIHHEDFVVLENTFFSNPKVIDEEVSRIMPCFVHQKTGSLLVNNSNFNIDLNTDYFCANQIDVGVNQCAFLFGEDATLNDTLVSSETDLNFLFEGNRNNASFVYAKYYYPSIDSCVEVSALQNHNSDSICHSISDIGYIFKTNAKIERIGE